MDERAGSHRLADSVGVHAAEPAPEPGPATADPVPPDSADRGEPVHTAGTIIVRITNVDTGRVVVEHLQADDYAVLYGPGWEKRDEYRVPITGDIVIRLRRVR